MSSPRPAVGDDTRQHNASDPPAAASCTDLIKQYGTGTTAVRALDGVSVAFPRGAFTAVMGRRGRASRH